MAAGAYVSLLISCSKSSHPNPALPHCPFISQRNPPPSSSSHRSSTITSIGSIGSRPASRICCSAANKPSPPTEISSTARIRSEVLTPFRSVRMFFYLAFIASGALGGLIATTKLISALSNSSKAAELPEILKGIGIDLGAVLFFAFLYTRESNVKNAQLVKLSREESLSKLKLQVDQNKTISVSDLRGIARQVILAGPASFIAESFKS